MSDVVIDYRFKLRRGTAARLALVNEVPKAGELIVETDTFLFKLGDGVTAYNSLSYISPKLTQGQILARTSATAGVAQAASLSQILDFIGSATAGDLLYRGSSAWARLPASSDGNVLTMSGGLPVWATSGTGGGAVSYLTSATVTGSAATTLSVTGLDLTTDQEYLVSILYKNASASTSSINLYFNGDTTDANYKRAGMSSSATFTSNAPLLGSTTAGGSDYWTGALRMEINSRPAFFGSAYKYTTTPALAGQSQAIYWATANNLTQITVSSSVASGLAIGTNITVYKRSH